MKGSGDQWKCPLGFWAEQPGSLRPQSEQADAPSTRRRRPWVRGAFSSVLPAPDNLSARPVVFGRVSPRPLSCPFCGPGAVLGFEQLGFFLCMSLTDSKRATRNI